MSVMGRATKLAGYHVCVARPDGETSPKRTAATACGPRVERGLSTGSSDLANNFQVTHAHACLTSRSPMVPQIPQSPPTSPPSSPG